VSSGSHSANLTSIPCFSFRVHHLLVRSAQDEAGQRKVNASHVLELSTRVTSAIVLFAGLRMLLANHLMNN